MAPAQDLHYRRSQLEEDLFSSSLDRPQQHAWKPVPAADRAMWYSSIAALGTATIVDAHSSWGKYESNAVLAGADGRFGSRGTLIKAGVSCAWIAVQATVLRKSPSRRTLAIINFAAAAALSFAAYRNYGIPNTHP